MSGPVQVCPPVFRGKKRDLIEETKHFKDREWKKGPLNSAVGEPKTGRPHKNHYRRLAKATIRGDSTSSGIKEIELNLPEEQLPREKTGHLSDIGRRGGRKDLN